MGNLKIGLALWSLGLARKEPEFKAALETAREIGVKGVQLWCVDYSPSEPCFLDPDRCIGAERIRVRELVESYRLEIPGSAPSSQDPWTPACRGPGQLSATQGILRKGLKRLRRP
jgi:sugar phosphate isomerase/epimerase